MKINQIINVRDWHERPMLNVGYGTRDKGVLKQTKKGKVYFLAKTYDKDIGELRSEVCASNIGRLFRFPVQKTWLCIIPQHQRLKIRHRLGVLIQLDVRRQLYTKRKQFQEDLVHGADLIASVNKDFGKFKNEKDRRTLYTLDVVVKALRNYVKKHMGSMIVWEQFFELLVFDALIGGTDRHYRNWGILEKADSGEFLRLTPAFDNGISLLWQIERYRTLLRRAMFYNKWFVSRAKSMFKKSTEGKFGLYEVLEKLHSLPEFNKSTVADRILKEINRVHDGEISKAIFSNVPQSNEFMTRPEELGLIFEYVKMRRVVLRETLSNIINRRHV